MTALLVVAVGAAVGAVLRALAERVQGAVLARALAQHGERWYLSPGWSTLVVNLVGTVLLGWAAGRYDVGQLGTTWLLALGTGVAGGLTTFSTLGVEIVDLARDRARARLALLVAAHVLLGLGCATIGYRLGTVV